MQEAALKGPTCPIEAYSCDLHVLDPVKDSPQVACMTAKDWQQVQLAHHIPTQVIMRMQDMTLDQCHTSQLTNPNSSSSFGNATTSSLGMASCTEKFCQENPRRYCFSWYCQPHTGRLLWKDAIMRSATKTFNECLTWCVTISSGLEWLYRQRNMLKNAVCA